jgi:hypothetical protein
LDILIDVVCVPTLTFSDHSIFSIRINVI